MERQYRVTWPQQIEADLIKTAMVRKDLPAQEHESPYRHDDPRRNLGGGPR